MNLPSHRSRRLSLRAASWLVLVLLALGACVGACSDDEDPPQHDDRTNNGADAGASDAADDTSAEVGGGDAEDAPDSQGDGDTGQDTGQEPAPNPDCDPLMPEVCAMPWPSNLYLEPDPSMGTGHRLRFGPTSLPANTTGHHVDPTIFERMDGYALGGAVLVRFANLDVSSMASEDNIAPSMEPDTPILLLKVDGQTLQPVPYWVELDAREEDPGRKTLFVRPAVILDEGTRYIVAFRDLQDTRGEPFAPSESFRRLVAGDTASDPLLAPRQERFDTIFALLSDHGVSPESLVLAWDFMTSSGQALFTDMLHVREDLLQQIGPRGPELRVDEVRRFAQEEDGSGLPVNPRIALQITGTFDVPHYMEAIVTDEGYTGYHFRRDGEGLPVASGVRSANFWLMVPHVALSGQPMGLIQYGHGLLGSGSQVLGGHNEEIAAEGGFVLFACDLVGMSGEDINLAVLAANDLGRFPFIGDRLHQGLAEFIALGQAARGRLAELPPLAEVGVSIDPDDFHYSGISQGGIFGATYMALAPSIRRGHLGVPGNNYAMLLQRSVDFDPYLFVVDLAYPDKSEQGLLLMASQILWDRTDPVTYTRHIQTHPFPGQSPRQILMVPAKGDYQVSPVTLEIAARSDTDIRIMEHYGRPLFGLEEAPYPHTGSGVVMYDFGNPWPPPGNLTPPEDPLGDPHNKPRRLEHHTRQMIHFFRNGEIIDVCGGDGCTPD